MRATLTGVNGAPLAGETLRFTYTQSTDHATVHICDAITDANGVASCYAASWLPAITFYGGYDVNFYGDANYLPATDHGTIA